MSIGEQFSLPETLEEKVLFMAPRLKPLHLLHLFYGLKQRRALVFCKSVDAANRLAHLLQFFADAWLGQRTSAAVYSAELAAAQRSELIKEFENGTLDM